MGKGENDLTPETDYNIHQGVNHSSDTAQDVYPAISDTKGNGETKSEAEKSCFDKCCECRCMQRCSSAITRGLEGCFFK